MKDRPSGLLFEVSMARNAISREDSIIQVLYLFEAGTRLLEDFAGVHPQGYTLLGPKSFSDFKNSAFAGVTEWDVFADHVQECAVW